MLLDVDIKYHRRKLKTMYMAMIDVPKAFESVSHEFVSMILAILRKVLQ